MLSAPRQTANLRAAFLIILVVGVSALFIAVCWPFLKPLLLAALFAGLSHPFYKWMMRVVGGRRSLAALLTLLFLFVVIAGPLSAFLGLVINQAISMSNDVMPWLQQHFGSPSSFNAHDWLVGHFPYFATYIPPQEELLQSASTAAKSSVGFLVGLVSRATAVTETFILDMFVMGYVIFFFLKDGK